MLSLLVLLKHLTFEALVNDWAAQFLPVGQVALEQEFKGLEPYELHCPGATHTPFWIVDPLAQQS